MTKKLYLILNGKTDFMLLKKQALDAIAGGIDIVQLGNAEHIPESNMQEIATLFHHHKVPLLIYDNAELALKYNCAGVHYEHIPQNFNKQNFPRDFLVGVTVGNNDVKIQEAISKGVAYISFCSLFPTKSAADCEIVSQGKILQTAQKYNIPVYVAGGIQEKHLGELKKIPVEGIVMISGILESADIVETVSYLKKKINE